MLSRRALLTTSLAAAATPLVAACSARWIYGVPLATPTPATVRPKVLLWHAEAIRGDRVLDRQVFPTLEKNLPDVVLLPLAHGDPDELLRRVQNASAGGIGPEILQLPGEWIPDAVQLKLLQPLQIETPPQDWTPNILESARWAGQTYGLPAAIDLRLPFYNDELLRNAGLIDLGRTTAPTTWAEFVDVSKRVAAPEDRWGSQLPSNRADDTLVRHVVQHAYLAGGEPLKREGVRVVVDTPQMGEALQYLLDLVKKNGAVPFDRQLFRLPETGKVGLWWAQTTWLAEATATGSTLKVGATNVPKNRRSGALVGARHWALGAFAQQRDAATAVIRELTSDDLSQRFASALSLPPLRRSAWSKVATAGKVWPVVLDQLNNAENAPLVGFLGYRTAVSRLAGELLLALSGKKPIPAALGEGEGAIAELLKKADEAGR